MIGGSLSPVHRWTQGPLTTPIVAGVNPNGNNPSNAPGPALVESIDSELQQAAAHYEKAIAGLEQVANASDSPLDPDVMTALHRNSGVIDSAITESRPRHVAADQPLRSKACSTRSAARWRCCRTPSALIEAIAGKGSGRRRACRVGLEQVLAMPTVSTVLMPWLSAALLAQAPMPAPTPAVKPVLVTVSIAQDKNKDKSDKADKDKQKDKDKSDKDRGPRSYSRPHP